jgi:hypothetical protein
MDPDDFKARVLEMPSLPRDLRDEISHSNLSFLHISFGIVPDGMTQEVFLEIIRLGEFRCCTHVRMPPLPPIQESWDGNRVADWLISADIIKESRRSIISKNLDGRRFLQGLVHDFMTEEESRRVYVIFKSRIHYLSLHIWGWIQPTCGLRSVAGRFLNMAPWKVSSAEQLKAMFWRKYPFTFKKLRPEKRIENVQLAFHQKYLGKEIVAHSFIDHIEKLCTQSHKYFACYTSIGQCSGMGKSRLLYESWENEEHALFILRICCMKSEELGDAGLETRKLTNFILKMRTQEQISRLLWCLLYLVLNRSLDENGYLQDNESLSHSLESLKISFEEVSNLYGSSESNSVNKDKFKAIQEKSANIKLRKPGSNVIKTVIPVVAFDQAGVLSKNTFDIEIPAGTNKSGSPNRLSFDTFRLIRRALHFHKNELSQFPFIFVEANSKSSAFVETPKEDVDYDESHDGEKTVSGKLFPPYELIHTFDTFSIHENADSSVNGYWNQYIRSGHYKNQLCNRGRPLWGALVQTGIERGKHQDESLPIIVEHAGKMIWYDPEFKLEDGLASSMTIAVILAASDWSPTIRASTLFKWKLALCTHSDGDPKAPLFSHPPEPILAMAALNLLQKFPTEIMMELINAQSFHLCDGLGEVDEFVAKIILLLSLPPPNPIKPYSSVGKMLKSLLGSENMIKLESTAAAIMLEGNICFSYFTTHQAFHAHPYENLRILVHLNAALSISRLTNPESGLFIPVVLKDGMLGCIVIQTRICPSPLSKSDLLNEVQHPLEIPRLLITMNMHPLVPENFIVEEDRQRSCTCILMEGRKACFGTIQNGHSSLNTPLNLFLSTDGLSKAKTHLVPRS